ncbi:hypothetical protein F4819DRAFT_212000 [Hypoxylon fuscum]|nr:hypothetical protein F4819DRAFT_212000 [Hypoxylon fuscum]
MSPLPVDRSTSLASTTTRLARSIFHLLKAREDDPCHPQPNIDLCEKPNAASHTTEITVGTLGGLLVLGTTGILIFLHFRRKRRDEQEWPKNNQELDDYGVGPMPTAAPGRPKNAYRQPRVDPDDDGHLPRPGARRDSLQSLARSIRGNPNAYKSKPDDITHDMKPVEPTSQL